MMDAPQTMKWPLEIGWRWRRGTRSDGADEVPAIIAVALAPMLLIAVLFMLCHAFDRPGEAQQVPAGRSGTTLSSAPASAPTHTR